MLEIECNFLNSDDIAFKKTSVFCSFSSKFALDIYLVNKILFEVKIPLGVMSLSSNSLISFVLFLFVTFKKYFLWKMVIFYVELFRLFIGVIFNIFFILVFLSILIYYIKKIKIAKLYIL